MATITRRLSPADHGRTMTLEEFEHAEVDEGPYRYELARGVVEVTPFTSERHGFIICKLYCALGVYRPDHPRFIHRYGGASEYWLSIPALISVRRPDVGVTLREAPRDDRGQRLPVLAMEVVSKGRAARERDYVTKREEYLAYGLLEYWIVDPELRQVTVLNRQGDAWGERVFRDDQPIESLVLPGLAPTVESLWIDIDEAVDFDEEAPDA